MAKQGAKTVVPRLRFPEFRGASEWSTKSMNELYSFMRNNILSRDKLNYEFGLAKNIHYGDIHTKFPAIFDITQELVPFINESEVVPDAASEDYCVEGDLIFADASEDMGDVGKSMEIVRLAGERLLSGQHTILARRRDDALIVGFGGHLFRSGLIRSRIEKEAQGTKVYQISSSRLGGIDVTFPSDRAEQQKIADCLTSLDEVLAAQGRKVEALKAHKRGLMQQLFPREGETRPRLRFPEFRNAPEWEEKKLNHVARLRNGYAFKSSEYVETGPYRIITIANVQQGDLALDSTKIISALPSDVQQHQILRLGDILISMTGNVGRVCRVTAEGLLLNQRVGKLVPGAINHEFFYQLLQRDEFRSAMRLKAAGGAQGNLSAGDISEYIFCLPEEPKEQQRIADCLSSLDTQIAAETNQLAALKTHKQGLIQQLFPAQEEG